MSRRHFREMLENQWSRGNFVCVGLDSDYAKIPECARKDSIGTTIAAFNRAIVEATKDIVCAYKPNMAFYERYGREGLDALSRTILDTNIIAPGVPVILDFKRADIDNTNIGYVEEAFDLLNADAVTVHPYLGGPQALKPFLDRKEKGIFVLCRTSNKGAEEFQDLRVEIGMEEGACLSGVRARFSFHPERGYSTFLFNHVAYRVRHAWNSNGNCGVVAGATYPEELEEIRRIVGGMPILIPGIGAQGGDVEKTVKAGKDSRGRGMVINSSRGIIFASNGKDFAEAARRETEKLHNLINQYC